MMVLAKVGRTQTTQTALAEILRRGEAAQLRKDFPQAAEEYRKALKLKPSPEIYEKLGLVYFLQNSHAQAIEAFSEALRLDPNRWGSQLFLGIELYRMNRFQEALTHIRTALQLNPRQNDSRYWLGLTYDALGDYQQGIGYLRSALENDPKNLDILYALAEAYLDLSTILANRLDAHPEDHKRREALEERVGIKKLVASRGVEPWEQLVSAWRRMEDAHKEVFKAPQTDEDALFVLSRVYGELAQLTADRVRELEPDSYRAHQLLGEAFEGKEDYESALEEYRKALRLSPEAPGLHYSIGHAYWQMKRFDEAIPEMDKELVLNPNHASANYALGHIYLYKREVPKAAHYLQVAVEAKPDFVEARKQWGKALSLLHDDQKAAQQLELAAAADPQDDSVHYLLAGVYRKMGLEDKAQRELGIFDELRRQKHRHNEPPE
jgi:tetratricopeptide (TPR) repeat protein